MAAIYCHDLNGQYEKKGGCWMLTEMLQEDRITCLVRSFSRIHLQQAPEIITLQEGSKRRIVLDVLNIGIP